jgi:anaerobic selenocysteine-containing dehydrogenase
VLVRNEQGTLTVWLSVTEAMHRGVVSLPGKWWSVPAETAAVANMLTPSSWSPGGQPAFNEAFVEVVETG